MHRTESRLFGSLEPPAFLVARGVEMNDVTSESWLSVDEIAGYLGFKRDTVFKWIERRRMPAHKVGSLWKFRRDEVDAWVRTGEAGEFKKSRTPK